MQDFIISELTRKALALEHKSSIIINAVLESNYELPPVMKKKRPSFLAFKNVLDWGGSVENAFISSLSTLNSKHGCFSEAYNLIDNFFVKGLIYKMDIYPGFGNPIIKDNSDIRCLSISDAIRQEFPNQHKSLQTLIKRIRSITKKDIYPNLVFWNAAAVFILGLPKRYSSILFVMATQLRYLNEMEGK
jgi:hypothetical protein